METTNHKHYPVLDLVRFIAAIFVILIHIFPEGTTSEAIGIDHSIPMLLGQSFVDAALRTAVPIFFVISGFLLFKRIEEDKDNKWKYIGKFCLRLLFLYLFWYIVGLPITIRDIIASQGDTHNLVRYIIITLWKGAPRGYWFLVALALSVLIVALINSKKSLIVLTIIAGLLYIYGCFNCAYFGVFTLSNDPVSNSLYTVGNYLELSFCVLQALLFVLLGKVFAVYGTFKIKGNIALIPIAFLLMFGEVFLTRYINVFICADAFLTLPLFVFLFMNYMLNLDVQNEKFSTVTKKLKKVGSFSYLFHIQFFYYTYWIASSTGENIFMKYYALMVIPFFMCIALSFGLQTLFEYLSKYKYLKFLKYSY